MKFHGPSVRGLATVAGLGLAAASLAVVAPAAVADTGESPIDQVLATSPAVEGSIAGQPTQESALQANVLSVDGADGVVQITLPVSAASDVTIEQGIVELSGSPSYSVVPVVLEDGSTAVHSVINDISAPSNYDYTFDLAAGARIELNASGGGATVFDSEGAVVLFIATPWAIDANGESLDTHYTVSGVTLTQHVSFDENTAFPVVADPWLGIDLVANWSWSSISGMGWRLNVDPTVWARGGTGNVAWVAMGEAGWSELGNKMTASERGRLNESGKQQYICHMGFAGADPQWNMELYTPNKGLAGFVASSCN